MTNSSKQDGKRCMKKGKVRAWYDKSADILCLLFKEGQSHKVIEADPDVRLELGENGKS